MEETASVGEKKKLKIALQGGGSHGAYAWGVLDVLLQDPRLEIEAMVGTSAGAMNAVIATYGLITGGPARAREILREFWQRNSEAAKQGPFRPTWLDRLKSRGNLDFSPAWGFFDAITRIFSPYELNPKNHNPLRELIATMVDFDVLRQGQDKVRLFIAATNVLTGRLRIFQQDELSPDTIMASACLPLFYQAVRVGDDYFWDGGFSGNPPIFPLIYSHGGNDILVIQINPINIPDVPRTSRAILDRATTLSFNSSLMREMRAIQFITDLLDRGELDGTKYPRVNIHTIDAETELAQFSTSSMINADWDFLSYLYDVGRRKGQEFLDNHFDKLGVRSSTDIREKFL